MREIKFRAWDRENQRLYEVVYISYEENGDVLAWRKSYEGERVDWCTMGLKVGTESELMQYTGLKDVNGCEIYEGDIVDYGAFSPSVIVYENGTFWARLGQYPMNEINEFEVLGNVYENPELNEI